MSEEGRFYFFFLVTWVGLVSLAVPENGIVIHIFDNNDIVEYSGIMLHR